MCAGEPRLIVLCIVNQKENEQANNQPKQTNDKHMYNQPKQNKQTSDQNKHKQNKKQVRI